MGNPTLTLDRKTGYRITSAEYLWLAGLTLAGLLTRMLGIAEWSIAGDEFYTVAYAAERSQSFIQPAYYMLVVWSTNLFGDTEWAARFPAALLGTVSIPVYYWVCRDLFGRNIALLGCLLIVLSSWHLYHSQMSRFYSGVFLFAVLSYFLYYKALRANSLLLLGLSLLSNVLGILFHATAILVPAACAAYSLYLVVARRGARQSGLSLRVAQTHLLIFGGLGLAGLPVFLQIVERWGGVSGFEAAALARAVQPVFQLALRMELVLFVGGCMGLLYLWRRQQAAGTFFAFGIGIPLLGLLVSAILLPPVRAKYIISTLPLFITLTAFLCSAIAERAPRIYNRQAQVVLVIFIIVGMLPGFVSYYTAKSSLDMQDVVSALSDRYAPGDRIVVFSHAAGYHFEKQFPEESLQIYGTKNVWKDALKPYEDREQRVWVLVDTYRNQQYESGLHRWLLSNTKLVWRKYETRYDYPSMGYELYRSGTQEAAASAVSTQHGLERN